MATPAQEMTSIDIARDEKRSIEKDDLQQVEAVSGEKATSITNEEGVHITAKTWWVIFILSSTFGLSFWPVPTTSAMLTGLATKFNATEDSYWFVPAYTTACALSFVIAGAVSENYYKVQEQCFGMYEKYCAAPRRNSDIFGRRLFLLFGNVLACVGFVTIATAKGSSQLIAGLSVTGFGGGFCQMAMCSIPEMIPNKFRHIGVVMSDGFVFVIVIIGPVVGRYAIESGNDWKYIYWGGFIAQFISLVSLAIFYHPPKHPKGVPWKQGIRGLDYIGTALIIPGVCLVLVGIVNTTYKTSSNVTVVAPMVVGFGVIILFGLWETFSKTEYKLCPPRIFRSHNGREFTVPFIVAFIVTMTYYASNVTFPTMVSTFWVDATTSRSKQLLLTLPPNLGLVFGSMLLISFGNILGHWKWTLCIAWTGMVLWGGLLGVVTPFNQGTMIAFAFLEQTFFGWAQYESIAFTQLGVHQHDLGISGGLAGVARYAGGSLAQAIYTSILTNTQASRAAATVPQAAIAAGLSASSASQLLAAFPLGTSALEAIPGMNDQILAATTLAYKWSYAHALKITALSSLSFGGLGFIMCLLCENIDKKMNNKTEIFLENDINADKNEFH